MALSKRRAASVVNWLTTDGGMTDGRLEVKGFGKTRPVAANRNPDGSDYPGGSKS